MNIDRRKMIIGAGATIATPSIFVTSSWAGGHSGFTNAPTGSTVTLGFNVPQTGPYADEGADQLLAYQLAVEHLNGGGDGGMMNTFSSKALQGNGILGKKVEYVTGDTQTKSDAARASAKSMIEKDGAVMITGGSSSGVAVAVQTLCQEAGVIFMAGVATAKSLTGQDKKPNGFRHFLNSNLAAGAVASAAASSYGSNRRAFHITGDYSWGWQTERAMGEALERRGWRIEGSSLASLSSTDFSSNIRQALNSDADVLILNQYGGNLANSLTNAFQFGVRDKLVNGNNYEILIPMHTSLTARRAGRNVEGILGASNWHWSKQDEGSKAMVKSFGEKYGYPPSEAAHTAYCQTILYADAAERAGTFNPCGLVEALENFEFDGLGNDRSLYSKENHQCYKNIPILSGKQSPRSEFDMLEIVGEEDPCDETEECPDDVGRWDATCNPGA